MKKIFLFLFPVWFFFSCASIPVKYYDGKTNLKQYHTFAYIVSPLAPDLPVRYKKIIIEETDLFLQSLGMQRSTSSPDLLIQAKAHIDQHIFLEATPPYRKAKAYQGNFSVKWIDSQTKKRVFEIQIPLNFNNTRSLRKQLKNGFERVRKKYFEQNG